MIVDKSNETILFLDPKGQRNISVMGKKVIDSLIKCKYIKNSDQTKISYSTQEGNFECGYYCLIVIFAKFHGILSNDIDKEEH